MGLKDKLASLLPSGGVRVGRADAPATPAPSTLDRGAAPGWQRGPQDEPLPFAELRPWHKIRTKHGTAWEHVEALPAGWVHGHVPVAQALELPGDALDVLCADERLQGFDVRRALFLDIETTGLSHGAGTYAFLIGLGHFDDEGRFIVRQLTLDSPEHEMAQLARFKELLEGYDTLVSFNGKSFDLSVLQTRLVVQRFYDPSEGELKLTPHLDLLHIHRAIWKGGLPDTKLQTLERHVLGFERHDDVDGEMIPALYFSYLQRGDARSLDPVLAHNVMDVVSMAALVGDLLRSIHRPHTCSEAHRLAGLGKLHLRRGLARRATQLVEQALSLGLEGDALRDALRTTVDAHRKLGEQGRAYPFLETWRQTFPRDVDPIIELSKHHEHRTRDYGEALRLALAAQNLLLPWQRTEHAGIRKRIERLRKRTGVSLDVAPQESASLDTLGSH